MIRTIGQRSEDGLVSELTEGAEPSGTLRREASDWWGLVAATSVAF